MRRSPAAPDRRVRLDFRGRAVRSDLSGVAAHGRCLWVANDEQAGVERLVREADGSFAGHEVTHLAELFDLPEGPEGEMDIEGLEIADGWLWVVGSHSLTRARPKPGAHDPASAQARLAEVRHHPNRHFLGRVPLVASAGEGGPRGACLKITATGGEIDRELRGDPHIARFLDVPAKENGFDIEGIAVRAGRVLLGLRGPVLRGWAMLLRLEVEEPEPGRLELGKVGPGGERYIKHFLDLRGLGIRELARDGDALLILAGPTMDLDGPVVLYRWPGALAASGPQMVGADRLEVVLDLPHGQGFDHAEGICLLPGGGRAKELLVVYDSPAADRLHAGTAIDADVFRLDRRGAAR